VVDHLALPATTAGRGSEVCPVVHLTELVRYPAGQVKIPQLDHVTALHHEVACSTDLTLLVRHFQTQPITHRLALAVVTAAIPVSWLVVLVLAVVACAKERERDSVCVCV